MAGQGGQRPLSPLDLEKTFVLSAERGVCGTTPRTSNPLDAAPASTTLHLRAEEQVRAGVAPATPFFAPRADRDDTALRGVERSTQALRTRLRHLAELACAVDAELGRFVARRAGGALDEEDAAKMRDVLGALAHLLERASEADRGALSQAWRALQPVVARRS